MANILIIDDHDMICKMLCEHLSNIGHETEFALTLGAGLDLLSSGAFDVVFLDVRLPDGNGLDALPTIQEKSDPPEVIIITGEGEPDGAELAINSGAWDYIEKPISIKDISLSLSRALQYRDGKDARAIPVALRRDGIIGNSPRLNECLDRLGRLACSHSNILITGETGTGKELFAWAIWKNSPRANKNFVVVDCAALPDNLVESMLFGHKRGAFTGADKSRQGLIKEAAGGTLFLDEVGELPLALQKKFLRVLQEHRFRPLGEDREVVSDFRLLAATNRDLDDMVQAGKFRQDLLFRLQSLTIELPPLRTYPEDIKDLCIHYMVKICENLGIETKGFSADFFSTLAAYDWPGNVRELIHTMEHALTIARSESTLFPKHLPNHIRIHVARSSVSKKIPDEGEAKEERHQTEPFRTLNEVRQAGIFKLEKEYLHDLMVATKGDIKEACRISGLSRSRLYHLLKKYQINPS